METITLRVGQHEITFLPALRYLGMMIGARLNFNQQVDHAVTKATAVRIVLSRLMPNVGGSKQNRRALLSSVVTLVITYDITIWAGALLTQETKSDICLPIECSPSGKFIAGLLPIEVLTDERKRLYPLG